MTRNRTQSSTDLRHRPPSRTQPSPCSDTSPSTVGQHRTASLHLSQYQCSRSGVLTAHLPLRGLLTKCHTLLTPLRIRASVICALVNPPPMTSTFVGCCRRILSPRCLSSRWPDLRREACVAPSEHGSNGAGILGVSPGPVAMTTARA